MLKLASVAFLASASLLAVAGCSSPKDRSSDSAESASAADTVAAVPDEPRVEAQRTREPPPSSAPAIDEQLEVAKALFAEARVAKDEKDLSLARTKAARAIDTLLGASEHTNEPERTTLLVELGTFAYGAGDLGAAKRARECVLDVRSRTLPDDHPDLQAARQHLAGTMYALGDLGGARSLFEQVLEVNSRTLPADHPAVQSARQNLGVTIRAIGDLSGAQALFAQVYEVRSRTLPDEHPDLQSARLNLAGAMSELGDLPGARALEEKVLEVRMRTLPDDHPGLQAARQNLAVTIGALGDLSGARALQEKVLDVRSRTLPYDHPDLQVARLNLAGTMIAIGDLPSARALLERALEVCSRTLPEEHPAVQAARSNLAVTLRALGDRSGARVLFEQVLDVRSRTLPDEHPDLQAARGNLAAAIAAQGDLAGARALEEKVLEVRSRTLPDDHPDLQAARDALSATIKAQGDLAGARALEEQVVEVRSRTLPDDHPDLQRARQRLAWARCALGELAGARNMFEQVLEVETRTLPDEHPDLQLVRRHLAVTIAVTSAACSDGDAEDSRDSERERCVQLILALCSAQTRAVYAALAASPCREAEERCTRLAQELDVALSFARGLGVFERSPELEPAAFVLSESARGAAVISAGLARRSVGNESYAQLRAAFVRAGDELAALARQGTTSETFAAARVRREAAERELIELARAVAGTESAGIELEVSSLARRLGAGAASVSFRRFEDSRVELATEPGASGGSRPRSSSTERLCAFVVRGASAEVVSQDPDASLTVVDLGPIDAIESTLRDWRAALGAGSGERGISPGARATEASSDRASGIALRRQIFDRLLPALGDAKRVVVALDDVLHLVPLDALPLDDSKEFVGDRWKIETRATLTELFDDAARREGGALVALGAASFNTEPPDPSAEDPAAIEVEKPTQVAGILRGGAGDLGFAPLAYTGEEAVEIGALYTESFGDEGPAVVLEKSRASRASLTELAPGARFLHIATHGWFAPESIKSWSDPEPLDKQSGLGTRMSGEEQVRGMSPMLLCGLALAGANLPEDAVGRAPGLITADEISTLDLSNCELAVLSACDTNVGERRAGQGVHSLQMALQMAGARSVITSLWKVPDEATKELMLDFYRRLWVEKKPKWQALWEAKKKLRDARSADGKPLYTTRDWAAWVLTGDPD